MLIGKLCYISACSLGLNFSEDLRRRHYAIACISGYPERPLRG